MGSGCPVTRVTRQRLPIQVPCSQALHVGGWGAASLASIAPESFEVPESLELSRGASWVVASFAAPPSGEIPEPVPTATEDHGPQSAALVVKLAQVLDAEAATVVVDATTSSTL